MTDPTWADWLMTIGGCMALIAPALILIFRRD